MLKYLLLLWLCCSVALLQAAPALDNAIATSPSSVPLTEKESPKFIDILESDNEKKEDGSYSFSYRSEDGTFREEKAVVVNPGAKDQYLEVTGSYSFIDNDGQEISVHYKADENGFVPVGSHIPEEISRAAQHAATLPKLRTHDEQKGDENGDEEEHEQEGQHDQEGQHEEETADNSQEKSE